jgi:predicted nucleotidyltransferase component of viral defense system
MHTEALTPNTKRVLESLGGATLTQNVYLAGGTALALYYGHRFSVDLDWFGQDFKFTDEFRRKLSSVGKLEIISQSEDTFHGQLDGIEVSFFRYPYKLLFPKTKYNRDIYLAAEKDIASMKLDAIASRGSKKDFIDMYFLLHNFSLGTLIDLMPKKFGIKYNVPHLLKALTYFEDVEKSPMPKMIERISWEEVKKFLVSEVKRYMK